MKKYFIYLTVICGLLVIILIGLFYNGIIWFVDPVSLGYQVKGIDVARYQGEIDWKAISSQGIQFAFIKATEGSSYSDPMFATNIVSSRGNNIFAGAYHFFSSESPGKTQAQNFINIVSEYPIDLPPVLDFEITKLEGDTEYVTKEAIIFLNELEKYFGTKPIVYTTYKSYENYLANNLNGYPLWIRDLFKEPEINGHDWIFWQYCNRGRLEGIDEKQIYVDLNVFNGSENEFKEYLKGLNTPKQAGIR
ncbi:MAG: hypothetical protein LBV08_10795 [Clostridiales bacterium]|nr:hypothetical protein [Clostridiales bacterium]